MDAFKNLRVMSFSFGAAGPYFTSIFALLGAEVIQVETLNRLDWCRTDLDPMTRKPLGINASPLFNDLNANKLSITLNLRKPEALEIAKKLIKTCDVLILDEINIALNLGLIGLDNVLKLIKKCPPDSEIILTGRGAPPGLLEIADLGSVVKEREHYYKKGILAREGIEF